LIGTIDLDTSPTPASEAATVVATYGRRIDLRLAAGTRVSARIKGRRLTPVCGDRVTAQPLEREVDWLVVDIERRDNELIRTDARGRAETLAANLSMVCAVAAAIPEPDWFILDRYLAAAELMGAAAVVVFNKIDLTDQAPAALQTYADIGYRCIATSHLSGEGIAALQATIARQTAILVGQSGVGKSSLINTLRGNDGDRGNTALRTGAISDKSGEGRHTTVNSSLIELPTGGAVIDSPGVRDFAPAIDSEQRVVAGFKEIEACGQHCRYANCRHLHEPKCAVKEAVQRGDISARRYESYRRLLRLTATLAQRG